MRIVLSLLCGVVGGLAGALFIRLLEERPAPRTAREARAPAANDAWRRELDQLGERLRRLERGEPPLAAPGGSDVEEPPEARGTAAGEGGAPAGGESGAAPAGKMPQEIVRALAGRPFGNAEANRLIGWLSRNKEQIPDVIRGLEKAIEEHPADPDLHVALATAWTAELINQPPGPQQGMVWGKVGAAYDAALALDPSHWQARFGKAFGTSMAPEFLGLRPEAIRQFEELKTLQGRGAPEPHHAQVYFRLGTLYKDAGNAEKARSIWAEGLRLFPGSEELRGTLEASTKK